MSKNIDRQDNMNFTMLKPSPENGLFPLPNASTIVYSIENVPPVRSSMTFSRDHPTVLFLFQLR